MLHALHLRVRREVYIHLYGRYLLVVVGEEVDRRRRRRRGGRGRGHGLFLFFFSSLLSWGTACKEGNNTRKNPKEEDDDDENKEEPTTIESSDSPKSAPAFLSHSFIYILFIYFVFLPGWGG